jgi:type VI secretion system protein ImpH
MADDARFAPRTLMPAPPPPLAAVRIMPKDEDSSVATHDFYQLLRRFECRYRALPRVGHALRLAQEFLRLGQEPSLAFAPGSVASVSQATAHAPWYLRVHCFGMLGPNGPLPLHLTEYVRQRAKHCGDTSLSRFLDLFHHRMLSLFYRAWADAQPAVQHDRADSDRFASHVASLIGLGTPCLRNRDALPDAAKLFYAGRLAPQARNAEGLRALISDYFGMPAEIDEFVGEWAAIPEAHRWRLGESALPAGPSTRLGQSTHLGGRVWLRQSRFRVVLGPLARHQFERVAPGGAAVAALVALVRGYAGDELSWEVLLKLESDAVPGLRLGACLLGQTSWLSPARNGLNDDLLFEPMSQLGLAHAAERSSLHTPT